MTILIQEQNGKRAEIDLTLVEKIEQGYEEIIRKRKNNSDRSHIEYSVKIMKDIKNMSKEQLEFLVNYFVSKNNQAWDFIQVFYDNPEKEFERVKQYNDLLKITEKFRNESQ